MHDLMMKTLSTRTCTVHVREFGCVSFDWNHESEIFDRISDLLDFEHLKIYLFDRFGELKEIKWTLRILDIV